MKLIIDIPEVVKHKIYAYGLSLCPSDKEQLIKAIMNGIPLEQISDEIKALSPKPTAYDVVDGNPIKDAVWETLADVLQIIDKYREGSDKK